MSITLIDLAVCVNTQFLLLLHFHLLLLLLLYFIHFYYFCISIFPPCVFPSPLFPQSPHGLFILLHFLLHISLFILLQNVPQLLLLFLVFFFLLYALLYLPCPCLPPLSSLTYPFLLCPLPSVSFISLTSPPHALSSPSHPFMSPTPTLLFPPHSPSPHHLLFLKNIVLILIDFMEIISGVIM